MIDSIHLLQKKFSLFKQFRVSMKVFTLIIINDNYRFANSIDLKYKSLI